MEVCKIIKRHQLIEDARLRVVDRGRGHKEVRGIEKEKTREKRHKGNDG